MRFIPSCLVASSLLVVSTASFAVIASYDPTARQDAVILAARNTAALTDPMSPGYIDPTTGNEFDLAGVLDLLIAELETQHRPWLAPGEVAASVLDTKLQQVAIRAQERAAELKADKSLGNEAFHQHTMFLVPYVLQRYGAEVAWSQATKDAVRSMVTESQWWVGPDKFKGIGGNFEFPLAGAYLLAADALDDANLLEQATDMWQLLADNHARVGGWETHATHYGQLQWSVATLASQVSDPHASALVQAVLARTALVSGHLYLPGGNMGVPQVRGARAGGSSIVDPDPNEAQHLLSRINLFVGDPDLDPGLPLPLAQSASDYRMPEVMRSIFLDKHNEDPGEDGFTFRTREASVFSFGVTYPVGWSQWEAVPWQSVTLDDGSAQLGLMYGHHTGEDVSFGQATRQSDGTFARLAHQHSTLSRFNPDRLLYENEQPTFRRLMRGRTAISLWDTSGSGSSLQYTQVHQPDWANLAPEWTSATAASGTQHAWRIGQNGDAYVAFLPLGNILAETDQGDWRQIELEALSGSIVEIASIDDFALIGDYAADLASRPVTFANTGGQLHAELEAQNGEVIRLDYPTDVRTVNGTPLDDEDLVIGMMESPWVSWDANTFELLVSRPGYTPATFDFGDPSIPTGPWGFEDKSPGTRNPSDDVTLDWKGSTDDGAIDHYELVQLKADGITKVKLGDYTGSSGTHTPAPVPGAEALVETAELFVVAVDDATEPNTSRGSNHVFVEMAGDGVPPSAPTNLAKLETANKIKITWYAATDNVALYAYSIFRDGDPTPIGGTNQLWFDDTSVTTMQTYTYTVRAIDTSQNRSVPSAPIVATAVDGGCGLLGIEILLPLGIARGVRVRMRAALRAAGRGRRLRTTRSGA